MSSQDPKATDPLSAHALTEEQATEIATEAYVCASSLVQMEMHRRVMTNQASSEIMSRQVLYIRERWQHHGLGRWPCGQPRIAHLPTGPSG